jgi:hypothetical protein
MDTPLTDFEKKVARNAKMTDEEFAREKRKLAAKIDGFATAASARGLAARLSKDELAVCRATGMSPRALLAAKERRPERPGLMEAHQALDAAHQAQYEDSRTHPGGADGAPDQELLDSALRDLKTFSLKDEERTYDNLVSGFLSIARLVNRLAPAYADRD